MKVVPIEKNPINEKKQLTIANLCGELLDHANDIDWMVAIHRRGDGQVYITTVMAGMEDLAMIIAILQKHLMRDLPEFDENGLSYDDGDGS